MLDTDTKRRIDTARDILVGKVPDPKSQVEQITIALIYKFMVEMLAPKKTETILDPACGTAGFLISAYKQILRTNTDAKGHSRLTPDEKGRLAKNFKGYDISPDMVRLSLVNLYLHDFTDPHIYEYDTLTDAEIAEHTITLEQHFWAHRRPPLHLRDRVREGQRFTGQAIELFLVRPAFHRPGEHLEESIAKVQYVRRKDVWHLFWKRAGGKWHRYPPRPEAESLAAALAVIHEDANAFFFG